jgi:hypothetical protein
MASLRAALRRIGETLQEPIAIRASFGRRTPRSLLTAMAGMADPQLASWTPIGQALWSENTEFTEEAQGIASDGQHWYLSTNGAKAIGIYSGGRRTGALKPSAQIWRQLIAGGDGNPHFGALDVHDGWVFVPIQKPHGIWRIRLDGSEQAFHKPSAMPDSNMFPWCAIHPVTGLLYTSSYDAPSFLHAYERMTLNHMPEDKIPLQKISMFLDRVQGAAFSPRGRLILVRSDYNAVFCYSGLNGHCFGAKKLGDFGSSFSEVEDVVVASWQINNVRTPVHILELDNDLDTDDFYLHSYAVPVPDQL